MYFNCSKALTVDDNNINGVAMNSNSSIIDSSHADVIVFKRLRELNKGIESSLCFFHIERTSAAHIQVLDLIACDGPILLSTHWRVPRYIYHVWVDWHGNYIGGRSTGS